MTSQNQPVRGSCGVRGVMTQKEKQKEKPKKCSMGEGDFLSMAYTPLGANNR